MLGFVDRTGGKPLAIAQNYGLVLFILRTNELNSLERGWLCRGELRPFK
jgi:hypothetical protein